MRFETCPVCETATAHFSMIEPDDDWEWKATWLMNRQEKADPIHKLPLEIRQDEEGHYWVSSQAVVRLGVNQRLKTFEVIEIPTEQETPCDCLWEVQGYRESTREYWVRPLRVPDYVPEP